MKDRAMQALYLLTLDPVAETICGQRVIEKGTWRMHKDDQTNKKYIVHSKCHNRLHGYIQNPIELACL